MSHRGGMRYSRPQNFQQNYNGPPKQPFSQGFPTNAPTRMQTRQQPQQQQQSPPQQTQPQQSQPQQSQPQQAQPQQSQPQQQQLPPPLPSPKVAEQAPIQQQNSPTPVAPPQQQESPIQQQPVKCELMQVEGSDDKDFSQSCEGSESETSELGRRRFRPHWSRKGRMGIKIPKIQRKRRQNARLRNLLTPKNSMMVLYELHPELRLIVSEEVNATNQMTYTVKIEIEGKTFVGQGMSKANAKQAASENALKAVLLEKLEQNHIRLSTGAADNNSKPETPNEEEGETMQTSNNGNEEKKEEESDGSVRPNRPHIPIAEDDVPWGSLASFALYKLFSEWQAQGFQLPPNAGLSGILQKPGVPVQQPPVARRLPPDANQKHPVQLLHQVRPGSQYVESREGVPPNLTFTFTVVVDGKTYKGLGTNKKDAKKECAKHALEDMGVVYT